MGGYELDNCIFGLPSGAWRRTVLAGVVSLLAWSPVAAGADGCPRFVSASQGLPTVGEWRTHPALADVNGDGRLDLAGMNRKGRGPKVWLGQGKDGWKEASTGLVVPGFSCGVGVALADVNADGHTDLAAADHCQGLFLYHGDGRGAWKLTAKQIVGDQRGFDDVQFGDLDGDGDPDLVAIGSFRSGLTVLMNDGRGNWTERSAEASGLPNDGLGSDLDLGDVNGDGVLDIAVAYTAGLDNPPAPELHRNVLWTSNGDGKYHPATAGLFNGGRTFGVTLGDVNGDGRLDLAVSRDRGLPLQVYLNGEDGRWTPAHEGLPGARSVRFFGLELADVTGDGHADLVAVEHRRAAIHLWRGDGSGHWQECKDSGLPTGTGESELRGWGVVIGDVNGDGRSDIAAGFGRDRRGSVQVWVQEPEKNSGVDSASRLAK